jgi:hypothetical protein
VLATPFTSDNSLATYLFETLSMGNAGTCREAGDHLFADLFAVLAGYPADAAVMVHIGVLFTFDHAQVATDRA